MLSRQAINAPDGPQPVGGYAQAVEVAGFSRILHVSGQIPVTQDGTVPSGFGEQCRLAWVNVEARLRAAGMTLDHLVPLHSSFDRLAPEAVRSGKGCFQAERCSGRGLGKDNSRRSGLGSDQ